MLSIWHWQVHCASTAKIKEEEEEKCLDIIAQWGSCNGKLEIGKFHFLIVFNFEEIQISDAELQDSILAKQTLFVTGGWEHPACRTYPKQTPGQ